MSSTAPQAPIPPDEEAPTLEIRLLGPVQIDVRGLPLVVDTRKAIALLAYLAVTGRPSSRDALAAFLWPDSDDVAAHGALRRTLSVLNAALNGAGLSIDRSTVALNDAHADVDIRRFQSALGLARRHGHGPDEACPRCVAWLDEAVSFSRGEFMEGFSLRDSEAFDEWQLAEAESHRRELAGALERLARALAAAGAWDAALASGRRWLQLDPLHEPAHRFLMTVLARSGELGAAVRQFRDCVRILDAELGVAPLQETTDLYEEIRAGRLRAVASGVEPPSALAAAQPEEAPGVLPLVGRSRELDALMAGYHAVDPHGRLLVIEGEPGIGKTRLAAALVEAVRARGGTVLEARAYAGEDAIGFAPIAMLVRSGTALPGAGERLKDLPPDLRRAVAALVPLPRAPESSGPPAEASVRETSGPSAAAGADPFGRARLIEGLSETLRALVAGPVPGLIVVDDLDWADASSVDVLAYLVRRLRGRPLGIVATWRPLDPADELGRVLAAAEREGLAAKVVLDRLGRADVATMAGALLGDGASESLIDTVFAESEGLPLYLMEALRSPASAIGNIPGGMFALLKARVTAVGEVASQVLAAGAVIGRSFDFESARMASGRGEEETVAGLEELVRRGIVREVGTSDGDVRFDFTHGRLRDVAYESLGLVRRRLLHRRVAEALTTGVAEGADPGVRWSRIAYHETLAGRSAQAAEAHRQAGQRARKVFANREAREHLEAALGLGHPATAELHEALGDILTLLGDYAGAIAHLEAAAALAEAGREWVIERGLGLVYARLGDWRRAASHVNAALDSAPRDASTRSALLADRSAIAGRAGDRAAAETLASEALGLAEAAGDSAGIARAYQVLGVLARARGDLDASGPLLERALLASASASDPGLRIAALNTLGLVVAAQGDHERAMALIREALDRCERQGDRHRQAALENNLADLLRAAGRREEAMDHLKRAVAIFVEVGRTPGQLEPEIWRLVEW